MSDCIEFGRSKLRFEKRHFDSFESSDNGFRMLPGQSGGTFLYLVSCQYTEKVVKENTEIFDKKLQILEEEIQYSQLQVKDMNKGHYVHDYKLQEIEKNMLEFNQKLEKLGLENQELKTNNYNSLEQINNMRQHQTIVLKEFEENCIGELKSLVYNSLDKIENLKEHNKSLNLRVFELEKLLEKKEVRNYIGWKEVQIYINAFKRFILQLGIFHKK